MISIGPDGGNGASRRCSAASRWTGPASSSTPGTRWSPATRTARARTPPSRPCSSCPASTCTSARAATRPGSRAAATGRTTPRSPRSRRRVAGSSSRPPRRSSPPTRIRGASDVYERFGSTINLISQGPGRWHRPAPVRVRGCVDRRHARVLPDLRAARGHRHRRDLARRLRAQRGRHHPDQHRAGVHERRRHRDLERQLPGRHARLLPDRRAARRE